jgi:hypothetical protein
MTPLGLSGLNVEVIKIIDRFVPTEKQSQNECYTFETADNNNRDQ